MIKQIVRLAFAGTLVLALSSSALAAEPSERCAAAKLRAVGKTMQIRFACLARASVNFDFDVDTCLERATTQLELAFLRAETVARGECGTVGDSVDIELEVEDLVDTIDAELAP